MCLITNVQGFEYFFYIADSKLNIAIVSALWIILGNKIVVSFYNTYNASVSPVVLVTCDCRNVTFIKLFGEKIFYTL